MRGGGGEKGEKILLISFVQQPLSPKATWQLQRLQNKAEAITPLLTEAKNTPLLSPVSTSRREASPITGGLTPSEQDGDMLL